MKEEHVMMKNLGLIDRIWKFKVLTSRGCGRGALKKLYLSPQKEKEKTTWSFQKSKKLQFVAHTWEKYQQRRRIRSMNQDIRI
jgi:hypothetical protein